MCFDLIFMSANSRFQSQIKDKHVINKLEKELKEVRVQLIQAAKEKKKDMERKIMNAKKKLSLKQLS